MTPYFLLSLMNRIANASLQLAVVFHGKLIFTGIATIDGEIPNPPALTKAIRDTWLMSCGLAAFGPFLCVSFVAVLVNAVLRGLVEAIEVTCSYLPDIMSIHGYVLLALLLMVAINRYRFINVTRKQAAERDAVGDRDNSAGAWSAAKADANDSEWESSWWGCLAIVFIPILFVFLLACVCHSAENVVLNVATNALRFVNSMLCLALVLMLLTGVMLFAAAYEANFEDACIEIEFQASKCTAATRTAIVAPTTLENSTSSLHGSGRPDATPNATDGLNIRSILRHNPATLAAKPAIKTETAAVDRMSAGDKRCRFASTVSVFPTASATYTAPRSRTSLLAIWRTLMSWKT